MNCLETMNLIELGELVLIGCNERKETRQNHVRAEYPFTNPILNKLLLVKKLNNKPVTAWKELIV